jgi:putative sigma-54 modulation protein
MQIEFTGRQTEVPRRVRDLAERRLRKLARVLHGVTHAHVVVAANKHLLRAEVVLRAPRLALSAAGETEDLRASLAAAFDKLDRQAAQHAGKRIERKRKSAPAAGQVRARRVRPRAMTGAEAAAEMAGRPDRLLIYRDSGTDRLRVAYRRDDGGLDLIEPEA